MLKWIIKFCFFKFYDIFGWCFGQFIVSGIIYIDNYYRWQSYYGFCKSFRFGYNLYCYILIFYLLLDNLIFILYFLK